MSLCKVDDLIAKDEVEGLAIRPDGGPLHHIFRLHHVEFARKRTRIRRLGKLGSANGGAHQDASTVGFSAQRLRPAKGRDHPHEEQTKRKRNIETRATHLWIHPELACLGQEGL